MLKAIYAHRNSYSSDQQRTINIWKQSRTNYSMIFKSAQCEFSKIKTIQLNSNSIQSLDGFI